VPADGNVNAANKSFKQVVSAKMKPVLRGAAAQRAKVAAVLDKAISDSARLSRPQEQLPAGVQTTDRAPVGFGYRDATETTINRDKYK